MRLRNEMSDISLNGSIAMLILITCLRPDVWRPVGPIHYHLNKASSPVFGANRHNLRRRETRVLLPPVLRNDERLVNLNIPRCPFTFGSLF